MSRILDRDEEDRYEEDRGNSYDRIKEYVGYKTQKSILLFCAMLLLVSTLFTLAGYRNLQIRQPALWLIIRSGVILLYILSVYYFIKRQIRTSFILLFSVFLINIPVISYFNSGNTVIAIVSVMITTVFCIQISSLFILSMKKRLSVLLGILILMFFSLLLIEKSAVAVSRSIEMSLIISAYFLFFEVSVPSLIMMWQRSTLSRTLEDMAYYDDVTGLPSRNLLDRELKQTVQKAFEREQSLAVFGLYVHGFSKINKRYGFAFGDTVFRRLALQLLEKLSDYRIYKLSNSLFILLPLYEWNPDDNSRIEEEIQESFPKKMRVNEKNVTLNYELLGTIAPYDALNSGRIVQNIYHLIKQSAPSPFISWFNSRFFSEIERRYQILDRLESAFENGDFYFSIQPQFNIKDGRVHGGEILVRWNDSRLGPISPGEFIPLIEKEERISELTHILLSKMDVFIKGNEEALEGCVFAVNLSASSLSDPLMVEHLGSFRKKHDALQFEIEITEDVFLIMDDRVNDIIKDLKGMGFQLALDDFGTGFSNLEYLQKLDVDTLKIDKRFIDPLTQEENSLTIVKAIIMMAHSFNIRVIAEGVETAEQYELLKEMNCDIVQGYYTGRPQSKEEFVRLI